MINIYSIVKKRASGHRRHTNTHHFVNNNKFLFLLTARVEITVTAYSTTLSYTYINMTDIWSASQGCILINKFSFLKNLLTRAAPIG
jgi:hypothetical protein